MTSARWLMPISSAASFFTPRALSSARRIVSRSTHSMFWRSFSEGSRSAGRRPPSTDTARAVITGPADNTTARSMVFSSSRTLPGQSYCCRPASTPSSIRSMRRPVRCACLRTKCSTSAGMSSRRSRSGGNLDRDDVEAVEQIFLELAVGDHLPQIAVGGGDDAHVDLLGPLGAERLELALLQHAQQLRLQRRAHRADLVEEDRAAVGQRELALLGRGRAREGAAHVAEELGLEQRLGNRRAVDLDERHVALRAAVVDGPRDQLLAGAGLAGDEHGALGLRHPLGAADDVLHRPASADDAVVVELLVALADAGSGAPCAGADDRARGGRRPAARRSRTASAGSRARRASSPRSRSRRWRAPSSSGSAAARLRASTPTYSRIRSRPLSSGMTLSTMNTSNERSASSRWASRGLVVSMTSWPASRSARPSALRIFSSSSTSRIDPRGWPSLRAPVGPCDGCGRQVDADLVPRPGVLATAIVPPSPSTMFLAIGRPRPVPPRLVVKYGSKTRGRSAASMPTPWSAMTIVG